MKPVVQLALDFMNLSRALKTAEAAASSVDWIEAGTPLIKSEGLEAVRQLRSRFRRHTIVADMKTMDAGRAEVEMAAKAGADVVGVLGAASDSTLRECVEAAANYGCKIMADMIRVSDPVKRAAEAAELGADYIGVHAAIDDQMRGADPFEALSQAASSVDIPLAAAGGLHSENAALAVEAGASIVIVGGAICKAEDPGAAAAAIRKAVETGERVATAQFKRADADSIRETLLKVSSANVSDALHRSGELPGLQPLSPGFKMAGRAVTVRTYPGDWAKPVEAIDLAEPGDVIVVDAGGRPEAVWGELATHSAVEKGLAGVAVNGAVRDAAEIRRVGFPAFARHVSPTAWEPKGFGEINAPIKIGGTTVRPGDWIVGDDDGAVAIPSRSALETANRAMSVMELESRLRREIREGGTLSELTELIKWEKR